MSKNGSHVVSGPKEEIERSVTSECGDAPRGVVVGGACTPGSSPRCVATHLLTVWDFFDLHHFTISMGLLWGIVNKKMDMGMPAGWGNKGGY